MAASAEANSRVAQVVVPAFDQIIKNISKRKHPKLAADCKSVIDHLNAPNQNRSPASSPPAGSPSAQSQLEDAPLPAPGVLLDLPLSESELILNPFIDALAINQAKVSGYVLDGVIKLIANGYVRGEPDHNGSPESKLLAKLIDSVCKCHSIADENVEVMVIKSLLLAVASVSVCIHGDCLLHVLRTCYDTYLISRNAVSQTIAKGAMVQILAVVFRRMEADSLVVPLQPNLVAELLGAQVKSNDDGSVTLYALGFITKIMQDIERVNRSCGGLQEGQQDEVEGKGSNLDSVDPMDKHTMDSKYWEISMYKKALDVSKGEPENGDGEKKDDLDVQIENKFRRDAYLLLRALCKLSMQTPPKDTAVDSQTMKGKIVALELLKIVLDNGGITFRTNERFLDAIRQYLCLSLLKNIASPLMVIFQLSCSIFISLVTRFRAGLKAEVGVFFPMIVLKVLESVAQPNFQQKVMVLQSLEKLCVDSQIWIDIFLNYDCDVNATNIFERVISGLLKTAQGVSPGAQTTLQPLQDVTLKQEAMKCLIAILKSMGDWMNKQLRIPVSNSMKNVQAAENVDDPDSPQIVPAVDENGDEPSETSDNNTETSDASDVSHIEQRRAYKLELQEGISLFNHKPSRGIEFLIKANKVGDMPEEIAAFLKSASSLNKTMIGEYLGEREDLPLKVMHAYVDSFEFQGMEFDEAIRIFLQGFRLPGEAQKIDRLMEKFAQRYCKCNPQAFISADTAYVLAYSVIMLNTDAHNPTVKNKMSAEDFIRNNRGIDDGKDLPEEYMRSLFERISRNEIKMKEDDLSIQQTQSVNSNRLLGLDTILNIVVRKRGEESMEDDLTKCMQEQFKEKAGKSESTYYLATDVVILKFIIEACWAPMLAAFSVPLDRSDDEVVTSLCLEGFHIAVHIMAMMSMEMHRDAFVSSLAKFTSLHSPADIKKKNIEAIQIIVAIADKDGNYLQEAWEHILMCISRFENLRIFGEGGQPNATLFAISHNDFDKSKQGRKKGSAVWRSSYDSAGIGGMEITSEQISNLFAKFNVKEQVGEIDHIFVCSKNLNSEAIVDFFKALCKVAIDELQSTSDPRVYSITKIVEIVNYNMNRIRLVWSKIWQVLCDFFVTVGCSENLSISIFAMDTLRQISMKFLDREELANYNFQSEFMKPFVLVMRKSNAVEIRELIIRCVSQMVLSRVNNVKSGWKSMFMVLTTAASDDHKNIVLLSFDLIEKIVRDYFPYITETETTTFTDCVNCLVAFTNCRFNNDINLNSLAFLRFCAARLAEGDLGKVDKKPGSKESKEKVDHLYLWYPLLAGVSEMSIDPRPETSRRGLEVLFETLRQYGQHFSLPLWEKVFDSVLFRIIDNALHSIEPDTGVSAPTDGAAEERDQGWIYETCTSTLQLVVDLFIDFHHRVNPHLKKVLVLLVSFIKSPHQGLAAIGIDTLVRLTSDAGEFFSDHEWFELVSSIKEAVDVTRPDFSFVLTEEDKLRSREGIPVGNIQDELSTTATLDDEADNLRRQYLSAAIWYAKSRAAIQMLLVQAIMVIYDAHGSQVSVKNTIILFDAVHAVGFHAHTTNSNMCLRAKLQELAQMQDPPLLRLENESYRVCLTLLQSLTLDDEATEEPSEVESCLVSLCLEVLQSYIDAACARRPPDSSVDRQYQPRWTIPLSSGRRKELAARAPLLTATLQVISGFSESLLEHNLAAFFPLISSLISCDHASNEVQLLLSDMLISSVGPILLSRSAYMVSPSEIHWINSCGDT